MKQLMAWGLGGMLLLQGAWVHAQSVLVCYGYGCRHQAQVTILPEEATRLASHFSAVTDAESERAALAVAVQDLYQVAAQYTPIHQDKGGNVADGAAPGRMDCVDHSQTDTAFLTYLAAQGLLRHHDVLKPAYRAPWFFDLHYASQIRDQSSNEAWIVDSWFHDFGAKPEVVPLSEWADGWSPE